MVTFRPASYRGVPFTATALPEHSSGRRVVEHEIVNGRGFVEDTGSLLTSYSIQAVCAGAGYAETAKELESALRARGAGKLIHPTLGSLRVVVRSWACVPRQGAVEFKIEFGESGEPVDFLPSTTSTVTSWTDRFKSTLASKFEGTFSTVNQVASVAEDAVKQVNEAATAVLDAAKKYASPNALGRIVQQVSNLTATAEATVRLPADLASNWTSVATEMARTGQRACVAACGAIAAPLTLPASPTPIEVNRAAHSAFVRSLLASASCGALTADIPATQEEALAALTETTDLMEAVAIQADDPDAWRQAMDLRDATIKIVEDASVSLPHLATWTPIRPVSVFEASNTLGASIDDLMARNGLVNPIWISQPLSYVEGL